LGKSTAPKKTMPQQEASPPSPPKPRIDPAPLEEFLAARVTVKEGAKIYDIRDGFLWEVEGVQRFRIDVWIEEGERKMIGSSFFVHYEKNKKVITDRTISKKSENFKI
jgi:hypothetical protein